MIRHIKRFARYCFPDLYQWLYDRKRNLLVSGESLIADRELIEIGSRQTSSSRPVPTLPVDFLEGPGQIISGYELLPRGPFSFALAPANNVECSIDCDSSLIVMLVVSALRVDPRVEREARALAGNGYRVRVIAPDISHPPLRESPIDWGDGVSFDILDLSAADFCSTDPYLNGEMLLAAAIQYKPLAFHCHDLNTCLIGLAAARYCGSKVVCDFHEWFSENVSWDIEKAAWAPHPTKMKEIFRSAENLVMHQADEVITVCDSIADELIAQSNCKSRMVHVIRNIPALTNSSVAYPSLRTELGLSSEMSIMLWQGGTGPTRLLEPVIESLALSGNTVFVIRGPSLDLFGDGYRQLAARVGVADRLYLLPPVKSADVVNAAHGADFGIWTLPKLSKNFYYALPNKIFEYLMAGLPIACADYPEARAIIDRYQVGVTFDPYEPRSIASALDTLSDPGFRKMCAANVGIALADMQAAKEWDKLVGLYDRLAGKRSA